ncbi:MAG: SIMPL domain-containing protein, partial [Gemmatimonadota bacterium]
MHAILRFMPALLGLAACGGHPAAAQTPAPPDDGLAHPYLYEVSPQASPDQEAAPFIEVSGSAEVSVAPDLARASFAVESRADSAADAAGANATTMDAVVRALKDAGIEGLRVETFGYTLRPEYAYPTVDGQRTRVVSGYTALNNVRVTVPDVNAMGR